MRSELSQQALRFLLAGGANTLLTLALYQLLLFWLSYALAFTLAFISGIVFTGLVYTRFVFERTPTRGRFIGNALFYLLSYGVNLLLLSVFIDGLGLPQRLAVVLVIALMVPVNFFSLRRVFTLF